MAMELCMEIMTQDDRYFYLHLAPMRVIHAITVPIPVGSEGPVDGEDIPTDPQSEEQFRRMCEDSAGMQNLFKRWEKGKPGLSDQSG